MSTHPYIPLYVDDYDAATSHLTVEEDGVYSRLIRLCWRTPGCSLPNEPAWIARKIRVSADDFDRIVKPVLEEFFKVQRGRLVQKRLKAEYDSITRKKTARANAGKKGGAAKALKTGASEAGNARDLPADTRAFPEPEPEPVEDITPKPPEGAFAVETFDLAWDAYPESGKATTSRSASRASWARACAKIDPERLLSAVRRFAASETVTGAGAKKPPKMTVWLDNERFDAFLPAVNAPAAARAWTGPPALWADVAARLGEAWAKVNLGDCEFHDGELTTSSPTTEANIRRGCSDALARHDVRLTFTARPNAQAA